MFSAAEDYQHIEFGVDELMDSNPVGVNDPLYKVSSNLNPQAPEFILGCQPSPKSQQTASSADDVPDESHFDSLDGPDTETSALDNHQSCQDMDGLPGSLGQRERKKKKKRPPGYYNYLDPSTGGSNSIGAADGVPVIALVNGHALGGSHHSPEDVDNKMLSAAQHTTPAPVPTETFTAAEFAPTSTANQRTCDSPDDCCFDLTSGASLSDDNIATSFSRSSSQSRGMAEGPRTADQQLVHLAPQSPELLDALHSSHTKSPPPSTAEAMTSVITSTNTTELEGREVADSGVANGLEDPNTAVSADGHSEDCDSGEQSQHLSQDCAAQPLATEQAQSPATAAAPTANLPKSWASLFHNSKPLPGSPQAFVEVKNVVEVVSPSLPTPEQPEKVGEIKEGPVHVSEDPMAPKLAGSIWKKWLYFPKMLCARDVCVPF